MKDPRNKFFIFILSYFFLIFTISAQNSDELWSKTGLKLNTTNKIKRRTIPTKFEVYQLNLKLLKNKLKNLPSRNENLAKSGTVLSFPNENGELENYMIFEASIMEASLQKQHPNIRSYIGKGIDNPNAIIRFSVTPLGLNAMIRHKSEGAIYIDAYTSNYDSYIVYSKKNLPGNVSFECKFEKVNASTKKNSAPNASSKTENANDGKLRTFRLAVATTGEYSQYHLSMQGISSEATDEVKKAAVLSAIITIMTRVNGIFETDIGLTMELVANNENIIFLNPETDDFTNNDGEILINESQTIIDATIGTNNYDIGHTFSTEGGGLAQLNSPCTSFGKARGVTGINNPIGDSYAIDYVAHEMGHQFGAHHTFNSAAGSCEGNRNDATAVEPGSGSTIMSYAGLCAPENTQSQSDSYFHLISIREIWTNITLGSSTCSSLTTTGNNAPTIETLSNYSIPISTPFALDANASDIDGDELSYTWEQLDTEITEYPLVSTATAGPAFRSVGPGNSSRRYFPELNTVIAGELSNTWEVLPSVGRTMKFGVNVRDNNTNVGQTANEETIITFDSNSGPFQVTSQASVETWDAGTVQTITWDVANSNTLPVNCSFVNILLSIDGGNSYPITLALNVENDGMYEIVAPNNSTFSGRIKVESVGNIFYALNTTDIIIQASEFIMNFDVNDKAICTPNSAVYTFTYNTFLGFNEETTFSAVGIPTGATVTFNPTSAISDNTIVEMTIGNIENDSVGNYNITVTGTATSTTKNTIVNLGVYSLLLSAPNLNFPENNDNGVLTPYVLNWDNDVNAQTFEIQIATDVGFGTLLEEATVNINSYLPQLLQFNTKYYWRVKTINDCGESSFSSVFNFTTANEICDVNISTDTPLNIPDDAASGIRSVINITLNKIITDVNVTVNITHPWVGDLSLTLISPFGKSVILSTNIGGEGDNYINTVFDDEAITEINSEIAPFTGTFKPTGNLSIFNNEESYGEWVLKVVDGGPDDFGKIENWSIEICGIVIISDDNDKDGVVNDIDLCPNTPLGSTVDENGCSDSQLDGDGDGVADTDDLCPNTTAGVMVDTKGCFTLSSDNFSIEATGETCPEKDNGQITIAANETYNYNTTINGTDYNFTTNLSVTDLAPGTYEFCITVTGETYEQCYAIEVDEGTTVSGKISITSKKVSVEITQGTAPYHIFINGFKILQTVSPFFTLDIKHGDLLEVRTDVTCEGIFSKTIELIDTITAYPNPTTGNFEIALPISQKEIVIELYNYNSQLISVKTYPVVYGKVQLNLENQPTGLYIAKVFLEKPVSFKIIKQ